MCIKNIIYVLSYAFQITGATLVLRNCINSFKLNVKLHKKDNPEKEHCVDFSELPIAIGNDHSAQILDSYIKICAFADIVLGYSLAVFADTTSNDKWCMLALILLITVVLNFIEYNLGGNLIHKYFPPKKSDNNGLEKSKN